jgi:thiol:disulfide interchange protein
MRYIYFLLIFIVIACISTGQDSGNERINIYNPDANAEKELNEAIAQAKQSGSHVMIQIGGDWCPWCIKMHHFFNENEEVDSIINADYVFMRINYSKENKNLNVLKQLEYPQRFGFPVIVILDGNGKRLHTQDTGFLEDGEGYSVKKIKTFLRSWNADALAPENYK